MLLSQRNITIKTMGRKPSEIIVNLKSPTRLENEMRYALQSAAHRGLSYEEAAAEVAKRYIEDAWDEGEQYGEIKSEHANYDDLVRNKSEWLKDNGITE